mmetsp:Transcript_15347/g.36117  ORF Transcript_15347/g.36117 Transcript_15347/m.36117 type:complete len:290 (-) Transcript_15347:865-1734(-)
MWHLTAKLEPVDAGLSFAWVVDFLAQLRTYRLSSVGLGLFDSRLHCVNAIILPSWLLGVCMECGTPWFNTFTSRLGRVRIVSLDQEFQAPRLLVFGLRAQPPWVYYLARGHGSCWIFAVLAIIYSWRILTVDLWHQPLGVVSVLAGLLAAWVDHVAAVLCAPGLRIVRRMRFPIRLFYVGPGFRFNRQFHVVEKLRSNRLLAFVLWPGPFRLFTFFVRGCDSWIVAVGEELLPIRLGCVHTGFHPTWLIRVTASLWPVRVRIFSFWHRSAGLVIVRSGLHRSRLVRVRA